MIKKNSSDKDSLNEIAIKRILALFLLNVKGKSADTKGSNGRHDGKGGYWLEKQMGLKHNASNTPDIEGFEMKNHTTSGKTTFGDWSADYYIFKDLRFGMDRDEFLRVFGNPNPDKKGRYSWSGSPCPKIGSYNNFGQKLIVDDGGSISAIYSYSADKRADKAKAVPKKFQKPRILVARWSADLMRRRVESKFKEKGWFKCIKDIKGIYTGIVFAPPITFEAWIQGVREGQVFFDSGMYQGNKRPYSQWRANNVWWDELVTRRY